jgi:hypothetical protein
MTTRPTPTLYPPKDNKGFKNMYSAGSIVTVLKNNKIFAIGEIDATLEEEEGEKKDESSAAAAFAAAATTTTTTTTTVLLPNRRKKRKTGGKYEGRIRVRFLNDSSKAHIRPTMLVPQPPSDKRAYFITPTTDLYRRFAKTQGTEKEIFIEIGSDFGQTTSIMSQRFPFVVGLDKSDSHVIESRIRHPKCSFVTADVFKNPECLKECLTMFPKNEDNTERSCVVLVDINGNRPMDAVKACVEIVEEQLKPRIIVVKSKELYTFYGGRKY